MFCFECLLCTLFDAFLTKWNALSRRQLTGFLGYLIYLKGHEGRGIGIGKKIAAYDLQDKGENTYDANLSLGLPEDDRNYQDAIAILSHLHVNHFDFITNNPDKIAAIQQAGFEFKQIVVPPFVTEHNKKYLQDKANIANHKIIL